MDIEVFRGRAYRMPFKYIDTEGDPIDLTGATVYFTVKAAKWDKDAPDTSALIRKTVTNHTNPEQGETEWLLDDRDTYIDQGRYNYDVVVEFADKLADPPCLYGRFKVTGTPTNRNVGNE